MIFVWTEYYMLGKHVIFPFSSINYMFSVDYIFLLNITYVFAIITCLVFLVAVFSCIHKDTYRVATIGVAQYWLCNGLPRDGQGFNSRWERCKNQASRPLLETAPLMLFSHTHRHIKQD